MADRNEIERALAIAEVQTGVRGGKRGIPLCFSAGTKRKHRIWTEEEEKFLRNNLGRISEAEIGRHLGRTESAVHNHWTREMHLVSMSKSPKILTAEQVAIGIGCDGKSVHRLMDTGRMPCRRLPSARPIRVIDRLVLMKWLLNPDHWVYFKPERVGALRPRGKRGFGAGYDFGFWEDARTAVLKARKKLKDEWLTPSQVVKILKIKIQERAGGRKFEDRAPGVKYINKAILKGNLKAIRWGNWWIKKSDLPNGDVTINYLGNIVRRR